MYVQSTSRVDEHDSKRFDAIHGLGAGPIYIDPLNTNGKLNTKKVTHHVRARLGKLSDSFPLLFLQLLKVVVIP